MGGGGEFCFVKSMEPLWQREKKRREVLYGTMGAVICWGDCKKGIV